MTEEPYRWLEAIGNRREYIRDQFKGATPVFALSRKEGILLFGVGQGMSKVFEIYDRHAYAALGHPVDIEKVRQSAIEAAHLEGFNRSPHDVTLRRLIGFSLSPTLKGSFEQIFSPPIMVEAIFAELGDKPALDTLVRVHYDGNHHYETGGVLVAHAEPKQEQEAAEWIARQLKPEDRLTRAVSVCLQAWRALTDSVPFEGLSFDPDAPPTQEGRVLEIALLDRNASTASRYRPLTAEQLKA